MSEDTVAKVFGHGYYPTRLGVTCDGCGTCWEGDFVVTDEVSHLDRLRLVTQHVAERQGWRVVSVDETYCPACGVMTREEMEEQQSIHLWLAQQKVYRDPARMNDYAYAHAIRVIEWGREDGNEYPVLFEEHRVVLGWVSGEDRAEATNWAKSDTVEAFDAVDKDNVVDAWVGTENLDDEDPHVYAGSYDSYVYPTTLLERMGPFLPNGGRSWADERRLAWHLAHAEKLDRETNR